MDRLGMEEGQPIEHNLVSRAIENAQKKVEGHHFDIRKHLLEYDDVNPFGALDQNLLSFRFPLTSELATGLGRCW